MDLQGKTALVTGASRGIGRAIALALANAGADVCCTATTVKNAEPVVDAIRVTGREALAIGCRVEDQESVRQAFERARDAFGPMDILVNNVGVTQPKPILEMDGADWDLHLNTNAKSVFLCSKQAAQQMQGRGGSIINIGSITATNAFPGRLGYCASKAAIHHMTKVMAIEWAELDIRVNCVAPGYIRTDAIEHLAAEGLVDMSALARRAAQNRLGTVEGH